MKVFISWSGERGSQLGEAIRDWLPCVLQSVEPYFTPADIDKGAKWDSEIAQALEESNVGIVILTQESLGSPWVMFEAGAIARSVQRARVCPILFGIKETDLQGPLSSSQVSQFIEEDINGVMRTINKAVEKPLSDATLVSVFRHWWPILRTKVEAIMAVTQSV